MKNKTPSRTPRLDALANVRAMSPRQLRTAILTSADPDIHLPLYNTSLGSGVVGLANEALFTQEHFSEPLTNYAIGWRDPENIQAIMDFIAPPVEVGRRFEYKTAVNAEEFILDNDEVRAIGASFKEVTYTGATVLGKTLNKGLSIRIDRDQFEDVTKAQQLLTAKLMRRLIRSEFARVVTILAAISTNSNITWTPTTGGASTDPDNDVNVMNDLAHLSSGLFPNRLLYARDAWSKRYANYGAQNSPAGYAGRTMKDPQAVAEALGMAKGMASNAVYSTSATAKALILASQVFSFFANDGADTEDATNIKRFWSATESGGMFRVYANLDHAKFIEVTVEHYSTAVGVTNLGARSLTVS